MSITQPGQGTIVAIGGCGFNAADLPLFRYLGEVAAKPAPKVCFLPTAYGDDNESIKWFYDGLTPLNWELTHLQLFHRTIEDIRSFLLQQDIIFVGGGSTANLLAVWRVHGVDKILYEAWQQGIVLSGVSAGANCWFEASITDSFSPNLDQLHDGLGILPGSACPHYNGEAQRRPTYQRLVSKDFPAGIAIDDGVAVRFAGTTLAEVVTLAPGATAYKVAMTHGGIAETPLLVRHLGE